MVFIETPIFTKGITQLLSDDEYQKLQRTLLINPEKGVLIRGSGGLRKMQWKLGTHGKTGGIRVIYYWYVSEEQIYMLFVYPKNQQEDLTPTQLKFLKKWVEEELKS
jgi:mRNA-degrading endonuclease RelE of RelBE toxin-antitoxin system